MEEFKHGIDYNRAKEYLQKISKYDKVIETAIFGGTEFEIIIAANIEYDAEQLKQEHDG